MTVGVSRSINNRIKKEKAVRTSIKRWASNMAAGAFGFESESAGVSMTWNAT